MSKTAIEGLKPEILWQRFYEISQVPRPSKKEEKIREYLRKTLNDMNIDFREDEVGNIAAKVPASKGYENAGVVVLQGHVDMVCEKNKATKHDFENDPLKLLRQDGWITADGTTLGSDNGIGVAAALAVATDKDVLHGPLELLFTVDEETGLTGANNLKPGFITGKILLNMDSEEDGAFYVGCSGGMDTMGEFDIQKESIHPDALPYELQVTGLKGGHSGLDISAGRANAIKLLARTLWQLKDVDYRIGKIDGGSLRNAIPREAEAVLMLNPVDEKQIGEIVSSFEQKLLNEYKVTDSGLKIKFKKYIGVPAEVFVKSFSDNLVNLLLAMPHGVIAMSQDIEGLVETSTNLATIKMTENKLLIGTSQRSSIDSSKRFINSSVTAVFSLAKSDNIKIGDGYPGWKPNVNSKILKTSIEVFRSLFNKEPEIKAIHAGLECGILGDRNPGLDMVSFGPTIHGAHSPDEKVNIESVEKFYNLLKGILKKLTESIHTN